MYNNIVYMYLLVHVIVRLLFFVQYVSLVPMFFNVVWKKKSVRIFDKNNSEW